VAGALLFWSLLLALATAKDVGAGYLALFWVGGGTLALLAWLRAPRKWQLALALACLIPALVLTLEIAVGFLSYFVPITGMLGQGLIDVVLAALVAAVVAALATLTLPLLHAAGGFGRVAAGLALVGTVGLAVIAVRFPYTESRPRRVSVSHVADGDKGAIRVKGGPFTREIPAPPPPMPAPRAEVVGEQGTAAGNRQVTLRIHGTSPLIRLAVPQQALLDWSLAPSLSTRPVDGRYFAQFYDLPPDGHSLTLTLRGQAPVEIELRGIDGTPPTGPEVTAALRTLPPWTTAHVTASRTIKLRL
jgi:hypothetical protein